MLISARGKYALGLMMDLAEHDNGEPVKLKDVAKRQGISLSYLEQVSGILKRGGFIKSYRGFSGGYKIRYEPNQYTVGMILRATEGVDLNTQGAHVVLTENSNSSDYVTSLLCQQIMEAVNDTADRITLQDLMQWQEERRLKA
ncbi:MAG: Rrf2 family transcriptional regulator [Lachnospiraceae bacterium]|nr:Rrf2 family transcriptional regulator [Lachnospiraceae bacterium]